MKGKEILLIAISSFFLTVIWIVSNVYHAYATSTIDSLLKVQIIPISPTFDQTTIDRIKKRTPILPLNAVSIPVSGTPTPTPSPVIENQPEPTLEVLPIETLPQTEVTITQSPESISPTP
ncbi:MAG: hypothetical protein Q8Q49_05620 [bacterium]|nr:hypothetical protein [bacterium]